MLVKLTAAGAEMRKSTLAVYSAAPAETLVQFICAANRRFTHMHKSSLLHTHMAVLTEFLNPF